MTDYSSNIFRGLNGAGEEERHFLDYRITNIYYYRFMCVLFPLKIMKLCKNTFPLFQPDRIEEYTFKN